PAAFVSGRKGPGPERGSILRCERVHEADRTARGNCLDQQFRQRADRFGVGTQCDDIERDGFHVQLREMTTRYVHVAVDSLTKTLSAKRAWIGVRPIQNVVESRAHD